MKDLVPVFHLQHLDMVTAINSEPTDMDMLTEAGLISATTGEMTGLRRRRMLKGISLFWFEDSSWMLLRDHFDRTCFSMLLPSIGVTIRLCILRMLFDIFNRVSCSPLPRATSRFTLPPTSLALLCPPVEPSCLFGLIRVYIFCAFKSYTYPAFCIAVVIRYSIIINHHCYLHS